MSNINNLDMTALAQAATLAVQAIIASQPAGQTPDEIEQFRRSIYPAIFRDMMAEAKRELDMPPPDMTAAAVV